MKLKKVIVLVLSICVSASTFAFNLNMDNGYFLGPGQAVYNDTGLVGINRFPDAQVRNIVLTGPLTGIVPFENNGADEPNVIAEQLIDHGIVDGLTSDGTLINENADTALHLNFSDPSTGESADVMVIAEWSDRDDGGEPILPDERGNLTFNPSVVADPGDPSLISRFNVVFTTGAAEIPLSTRTQYGLNGGVDAAGPYPSGRVLLGRLGDYDQDGFMDGTLVLAANSPEDLLVARGNPIAQIRPWVSDIPIAPQEAAYLTLSGILNNYPYAFTRAQENNDFIAVLDHLNNLDEGVDAILGNLRHMTATMGSVKSPRMTKLLIKLRSKLASVQKMTVKTTSEIDKIGIRSNPYHYEKIANVSMRIKIILMTLKEVAADFTALQQSISAMADGAKDSSKYKNNQSKRKVNY